MHADGQSERERSVLLIGFVIIASEMNYANNTNIHNDYVSNTLNRGHKDAQFNNLFIYNALKHIRQTANERNETKKYNNFDSAKSYTEFLMAAEHDSVAAFYRYNTQHTVWRYECACIAYVYMSTSMGFHFVRLEKWLENSALVLFDLRCD